MFSVCSGESIDIPPIAETARPVRKNFAQTEPLQNECVECQFPLRQDFQMQTDVPETRKELVGDFDPDTLLVFLKKVTPLVLKALDKNDRSHAFDRYKLLADIDSTTTQKLYSLGCQSPVPQVYCADISWNSTGTSVAIAYSSKSHEDWCEHNSAIAIWNLLRKDFNPEKPNIVIETDFCISSIAFHPQLPAVLAGGNFNGEVFIYNITKEDDMLLAKTVPSFDSHREPISGLYWYLESEISNNFKLISSSIDGKILIWRCMENRQILEPEEGFIVPVDKLPRSLNIKSLRRGAEVGITSLSFNHKDPSIFIIGVEGGNIFQCSLNSQLPASNTYTSSILFKFPVVMMFQKHEGHVSSVHFSPFSRNLFLSSGSEGEIHIFNLLQSKPVLKLHLPAGILQAQWSPIRPLVIIAVCEDGNLYVWDLAISKSVFTQSLHLTSENCIASTLSFDKRNPQLLATGSGNGDVQVWQLGTGLTEVGSLEIEQLCEMTAIE